MDLTISTKSALLQALVDGDGYGLELMERVREKSGGRFLLHQGSVYPALRELEEEGLAESYSGKPTPERGGRPRIYYRLTPEGRRVAYEQRAAVLGLYWAPGLVPGGA